MSQRTKRNGESVETYKKIELAKNIQNFSLLKLKKKNNNYNNKGNTGKCFSVAFI